MTDLDEEFQAIVNEIQQEKENFLDDQQTIIDSWIEKLSEPKEADEEKTLRNNYATTLARCVKEEKLLLPPFDEAPPLGDLTPLADKAQRLSYKLKRMPCAGLSGRSGQKTGAIPKIRKPDKLQSKFVDEPYNEFESPEEMAKVIARSKGQPLIEFIASIARHTSDYGQELKNAMNTDLTSFKEYVDHVLSQRIKDLTEVLDEEQNRELLRIKKDIERWQLELAQVKKRIKEMLPAFDIDSYRKDKNYIKKFFTIDTTVRPQNDSFERWKEEAEHRLKWINEMTCKMKQGNAQTSQELCNIKASVNEMDAKESLRQQTFCKCIETEMNEFYGLLMERDDLHKETFELQLQWAALEAKNT